jgi:hypothetical protein
MNAAWMQRFKTIRNAACEIRRAVDSVLIGNNYNPPAVIIMKCQLERLKIIATRASCLESIFGRRILNESVMLPWLKVGQ